MVSQPTQLDHSSYPYSTVPGVAPADFRLGGEGLPPESIAKVHERFLAYLSEKRATFPATNQTSGRRSSNARRRATFSG
jgi:hypothetical protein